MSTQLRVPRHRRVNTSGINPSGIMSQVFRAHGGARAAKEPHLLDCCCREGTIHAQQVRCGPVR